MLWERQTAPVKRVANDCHPPAMGALQTLDYAVCELVISLHQPTAPDAAPDAAPQRILPPVLRLSACSVTPFSMPSAHEIKSLFRAYLRLGRNFPNYNIRQ